MAPSPVSPASLASPNIGMPLGISGGAGGISDGDSGSDSRTGEASIGGLTFNKINSGFNVNNQQLLIVAGAFILYKVLQKAKKT